MAHFRCISFNCDTQHGDSQGPWSFAYRQIHVLVIGLYVLSYEAAVYDVVDWPDHFFVAASAFEHHHETFHVRLRLLKSGPTLSPFLTELFSIVLLLQRSVPISQNFVNPKRDLIAHFFKRQLTLFCYDHLSLLFKVLRIVAQLWFDHPIAVLGIKLVELFLLFEPLLKLLIVGLHVEGGMLRVKGLDFEQTLVSLGGCLSKKGDRLM